MRNTLTTSTGAVGPGSQFTLHAATQKVLAEPDTKQLYAAQSMVPQGNTSPDELDRFLRADFDRMAKLIKISGIKPE